MDFVLELENSVKIYNEIQAKIKMLQDERLMVLGRIELLNKINTEENNEDEKSDI